MPLFHVTHVEHDQARLESIDGGNATLSLRLFKTIPAVGAAILLELAPADPETPLPTPLAHAMLNELLGPSTP